MASSQIKIGGVTKDIHDHRLPTTLGTSDQVLKMNSGGTAIEWGTSGGGSNLYRHDIDAYLSESSSYNHGRLVLSLTTSSATPITSDTLASVLTSLEYTSVRSVMASGIIYGDSVTIKYIYSLYPDSGYVRYNGYKLTLKNLSSTNLSVEGWGSILEPSNFTQLCDKVTQLL